MQKLYGLIGYPVSHSVSPQMHNDCFKELGISGYYHLFNVKPQDLECAIKGMKALGIKGFNVTIPHKITCLNYLDQVDGLASTIGAVNTVVNENGKLVGYNTDGPGFLMSLKEVTGETLRDRHMLIIGAGGAARGIFMTLASSDVQQIDIANRTISRAENIIIDCPYLIRSKAISLQTAENVLGDYDIIINTTAIGMYPEIDEMPISLNHLGKGKIVCDIVYNPLETKFLREAKAKGAEFVLNGLGMLVYQGALAFEKWEGVLPDLVRMKQIALQALGGKVC